MSRYILFTISIDLIYASTDTTRLSSFTMKAPVFLVALALVLLQSVIAKPHGRSYKTACDIVRNGTLLLIKEQTGYYRNKKRNIAVEYITIPSEVIVWVNQYGSTLSVETKGCVVTQPVEVNLGEVLLWKPC